MALLRVARLRPTLAMVLAGWLLALAVEASPHLVHHAFDGDGDPACADLAAADHAPAAAGAVAVVQAALVPLERVDAPPVAAQAATGVRPTSTRGPPSAPLALA